MHELRLAHAGLLPWAMDMERRTFEDPWPEWAFRRILDSPGRLFLVAFAEEEPCGYAVAEVDTRGLHVTNLAVDESRRRTGVGRCLMAAVEGWGRRMGQSLSRLEVRETNTVAADFYRRLGYSVRTRIPGYYGGRCDAIVMIRPMRAGPGERGRAALAAALAARLRARPRVGVVLGSGLSWLAEDFGVRAEMDNSALPGMAGAAVPGHPGKVIQSADGRLVFLLGRRHAYQGFDGDEVALLPGALADLGVGRWLLTSSSGAVDPELAVGDAVVFRDHLNLSGTVPSCPAGRPVRCYRAGLREMALELARELGAPVEGGLFACCAGPEYETAAEIRLLRRMGVSTVSMSTAPEALALASQGCAVLALSLVTNAADPEGEVSHHEVLEAQRVVSERQGPFLRELLSRMAGQE